MAALDPLELSALAPDGLDEEVARSATTWTDEAVLAALRAEGAAERRIAAVWAEALRRDLGADEAPGFSALLPEWTERALRDALGPFAREYDVARRAALLREARRRGLSLAATRPRRPSAPLVLLGSFATVILLAALFVGVAASRYGGSRRVMIGAAVALLVTRWLVTRYVRPWLQDRGD